MKKSFVGQDGILRGGGTAALGPVTNRPRLAKPPRISLKEPNV
jgi:hypothetical protein